MNWKLLIVFIFIFFIEIVISLKFTRIKGGLSGLPRSRTSRLPEMISGGQIISFTPTYALKCHEKDISGTKVLLMR